MEAQQRTGPKITKKKLNFYCKAEKRKKNLLEGGKKN